MKTAPELPSDEDLARAAQDGHSVAFEQIVTRYERRMFHFFRYRTRNDADAQDLTQQLFVKVYRGLFRFDPDRKLSPWIFTIAARCAVSHYRSRAAKSALPVTDEEPVDTRAPDTILGGQEAAHNLWDWARVQLSPAQFNVLWLRIQEEMSIKDVARVTRHTTTNVKVMLHRARRRLRKAWPASHTHADAYCQKATNGSMTIPTPTWTATAQYKGTVL